MPNISHPMRDAVKTEPPWHIIEGAEFKTCQNIRKHFICKDLCTNPCRACPVSDWQRKKNGAGPRQGREGHLSFS